MRQEYGRNVFSGEEVTVHAVEFGGRIVLETEFAAFDGILYQLDLKEHGIGEGDYEAIAEFDDAGHDHRSVRIFHLAAGEKITLKPGDELQAEIRSISVAKERAKDGRKKIHIILAKAHRVYRWVREKKETSLVFQLWCGRRKAREHVIPLESRKTGALRKDGRVYPVIAVVLLPKGRVLSASVAYSEGMSSGDYILRQRMQGRTPKDIHNDFLSDVPTYDRLIPTRQRRLTRKYVSPV